MPTIKEHREKLLDKKRLKVSELRDLVDEKELCRTAYKEAKITWGRYFHSPVDKVAAAEQGVFSFDRYGAFRGADNSLPENSNETHTNFQKLLQELLPRREAKDPDVRNWLLTGEPLSAEKVQSLKKILFPARLKLTNELLFDQPICRLVHRNQLRRDLDYQVVYQLTPGQLRLIDGVDENANAPTLDDLHRNQRLYWGISETFQSLVAMFDSDLGSRRKAKSAYMTKEFIKLTREHHQSDVLAPDELNKSSPLRFWAPPPVFCDSVFHMLFWRSMITGTDLFGREVIAKPARKRSMKATLAERASQYYVLINWFNAAKFHLADYEKLFDALNAIARTVGRVQRNRSAPLHGMKDILLVDDPKGLLYPSYFPHSKVKFPRFKKVRLTIPCKSLDTRVWELTSAKASKVHTKVSDLLRYLRDKALETVIWSKYQMEIRSVGLIPIQHLYQVQFEKEGLDKLAPLARESQDIKNKLFTEALALRAEDYINDVMKPAIFNGDTDHWVSLKRVCGGTYRRIDDKAAWDQLATLKNPRSDKSSRKE